MSKSSEKDGSLGKEGKERDGNGIDILGNLGNGISISRENEGIFGSEGRLREGIGRAILGRRKLQLTGQ
jgi:hypothetical protein